MLGEVLSANGDLELENKGFQVLHCRSDGSGALF
jgi:hypothetical protein